MPITKERMLEILQRSNGERVHYVDTDGFTDEDWRRFDDQLSDEISIFCRTNPNAEDLHAFARTYNCDSGLWALEDLLDNPACEAATALYIYSGAQPEYFLEFADRAAVIERASVNLEGFDFMTKLQARYLAGDFAAGSLSFDPAEPGLYFIQTDEARRAKFVRALPKIMYEPVVPVSNVEAPSP